MSDNDIRKNSITIYIWRSDGVTTFGHAALKTSSNSQHNYMSHWPKTEPKKGASINRMSEFKRDLSKDIAAEGRQPDFIAKLEISSDQLKRIEKYIEARKNTHETWNGLSNCTDAVVKTLRAGGIANYKLKFNRSYKDIVSTPIELIEKIKEDVKRGKVNFKIQRDENQHWNKEPREIRKISENNSQHNTANLSALEVAKNVHSRIAGLEKQRIAQAVKEASPSELSIG